MSAGDAHNGHFGRGADLIAAERRRQVEQEGWTPQHDAEHADDAMACAAAVYALPAGRRGSRSVPHPGNNGDRGDAWRHVPYQWPWAPEWYKPTPDDRIRELVKAGALIAAEIDRLQARGTS